MSCSLRYRRSDFFANEVPNCTPVAYQDPRCQFAEYRDIESSVLDEWAVGCKHMAILCLRGIPEARTDDRAVFASDVPASASAAYRKPGTEEQVMGADNLFTRCVQSKADESVHSQSYGLIYPTKLCARLGD